MKNDMDAFHDEREEQGGNIFVDSTLLNILRRDIRYKLLIVVQVDL